MSKIVFTGGGTAGHVMPNIALIEKLHGYELHYIGCPDSMEQTLIHKFCPNVKFHALSAFKLTRGSIFKNLLVPFKLWRSKRTAKKILRDIKPNAIFSKGGYVALPVTLAAKQIPVILHESDATFGLANRMALKKCRVICTSFKTLADKTPNTVHTGAPLRRTIYKGDRAKVEKETDFRGRKNLLITGGSLGAAAINDAVLKNLDALTKRFDIVHIVGKNNHTVISRPHYKQIDFTDKIADYFAWADFCVTRGGANALFELVALKIPSLVIPLPKGVSRGDQVDNAAYFKKLGCIHVLEQEKLFAESNALRSPLIAALDALIEDKAMLKANCAKTQNIDGTQKILEIIESNLSTSLC